MTVLVCYDVADDRLRRRVARVLGGYGQRVQWSVFACDVTRTERDRLVRALRTVCDGTEASVWVVPTAGAGVRLGAMTPLPVTPGFWRA